VSDQRMLLQFQQVSGRLWCLDQYSVPLLHMPLSVITWPSIGCHCLTNSTFGMSVIGLLLLYPLNCTPLLYPLYSSSAHGLVFILHTTFLWVVMMGCHSTFTSLSLVRTPRWRPITLIHMLVDDIVFRTQSIFPYDLPGAIITTCRYAHKKQQYLNSASHRGHEM
jgi:hypothetical protein